MSEMIYNRIKNFVDLKYKDENLSFFIKEENTESDAHINPKILILNSTGGKSFCSGGSLINLYEYKLNKDYNSLLRFYKYELICDYYFYKMNPKLICIWEGFVMGGRVGISINSLIRIATDNTVFAMPETSIGYFPDVGAAYFLTRIFNKEASIGLYCGLIGHRLIGNECLRAGAATHFVKKENLEMVKKIIIEYGLNAEDEVIELNNLENIIAPYCDVVYSPEEFSFKDSELIKRIFLFDTLECIFTRLNQLILSDEESEYNKGWARETISQLNRMSPQGFLIFFEYAKRALDFKDIVEAYRKDTQLFGKLIYDGEFFEGIRAVVIDKDKNPKWNHNSIKDIGDVDQFITHFFEKN